MSNNSKINSISFIFIANNSNTIVNLGTSIHFLTKAIVAILLKYNTTPYINTNYIQAILLDRRLLANEGEVNLNIINLLLSANNANIIQKLRAFLFLVQ